MPASCLGMYVPSNKSAPIHWPADVWPSLINTTPHNTVGDEHGQPPPLPAVSSPMQLQPPPLGAVGAQASVATHEDLEARELAQHESDAVLDMGRINLLTIAKDENKLTPRSGPFSPERNQEVFKALLYLMDAEKKKRPNVVDDYDAMRWYYAR